MHAPTAVLCSCSAVLPTEEQQQHAAYTLVAPFGLRVHVRVRGTATTLAPAPLPPTPVLLPSGCLSTYVQHSCRSGCCEEVGKCFAREAEAWTCSGVLRQQVAERVQALATRHYGWAVPPQILAAPVLPSTIGFQRTKLRVPKQLWDAACGGVATAAWKRVMASDMGIDTMVYSQEEVSWLPPLIAVSEWRCYVARECTHPLLRCLSAAEYRRLVLLTDCALSDLLQEQVLPAEVLGPRVRQCVEELRGPDAGKWMEGPRAGVAFNFDNLLPRRQEACVAQLIQSDCAVARWASKHALQEAVRTVMEPLRAELVLPSKGRLQ